MKGSQLAGQKMVMLYYCASVSELCKNTVQSLFMPIERRQ